MFRDIMADGTFEFENLDDVGESSFLGSKIRENIYELEIKRKLLQDSRNALTKLDAEKHKQVQRAVKAERELSEVKIHLEVAIKAAREAEAERSSTRELLARQQAQLEATSKEREILQQFNRDQQLEMIDLQRELEDSKLKMKSQSYILEVIQKKDMQIHTTIDTLKCEVVKFENSQIKLKKICSKITSISKVIITFLNQQKNELSEYGSEKSKLEDKVISLNVQLRNLIEENSKTIKKEEMKCEHIFEWESAKSEMQNRLKDCNQEIDRLQSSLDSALSAVTRYQAIDYINSEKIRLFEEELKRSFSDSQKEIKFVQTEKKNVEEDVCKKIILTVPNSEIQSSEVDTCEGKCS